MAKFINSKFDICHNLAPTLVAIHIPAPLLYGEFNDVIEAPVRKVAASISSYADQKVNIIFVNDVVNGFLCACTAHKCDHSIYNLGGYRINTRELVAAVQNTFPESQITIAESEKERAVASAIDSTLAKEELGYEPQLTLYDAIRNHNQILAKNL